VGRRYAPSAALPDAVAANLAVAGGVLYAGASDGTVTAFDAAGCGSPACGAVVTIAAGGVPEALVVSGGRPYVSVPGSLGGTGSVTAFAPA
jgi:hypothetical protein